MNIRETILQEMANLLKEELSERKIDYKTLLSTKVIPVDIQHLDHNPAGGAGDYVESRVNHNKTASLKNFLSSGKILLNIFAPWCGPCKNEFKLIKSAIERTQAKYIGLNIDHLNTSGLTYDLMNSKLVREYDMPLKTQLILAYNEKGNIYGNTSGAVPVNILFVNGKPIKAVGAFKSEQEVIDFINQTEQKPAVPTQQAQPVAPAAPAAKPAAPAQPAFKVGDRVSYPKAGIFTVAAINGNKVTIKNSKGQQVEVEARWLTKR